MHQPDVAAADGSGVGGRQAEFAGRLGAEDWLDPGWAASWRVVVALQLREWQARRLSRKTVELALSNIAAAINKPSSM